jgi:hypothetical protein
MDSQRAALRIYVMKRISILGAAALMVAGTYTPAQAITVNEPGYFNKCAAAYVQDPALYDRDCAAQLNKGLTTLEKGEPVIDCPDYGLINTLNLPKWARVRVADIDPCYTPPT